MLTSSKLTCVPSREKPSRQRPSSSISSTQGPHQVAQRLTQVQPVPLAAAAVLPPSAPGNGRCGGGAYRRAPSPPAGEVFSQNALCALAEAAACFRTPANRSGTASAAEGCGSRQPLERARPRRVMAAARARRSDRTVDPGDEGAAVDVRAAARAGTGAVPVAELVRQLRELLAEPEQARLLLQVVVVELLIEVVEDRLRAVSAERLVVLLVAVRARARDDEEEAGAALIAPGLLDERARSGIELRLRGVELDDVRAAHEGLEHRVEVAAGERGDLLGLKRLATPAATAALEQATRARDAAHDRLQLRRAVRVVRHARGRDVAGRGLARPEPRLGSCGRRDDQGQRERERRDEQDPALGGVVHFCTFSSAGLGEGVSTAAASTGACGATAGADGGAGVPSFAVTSTSGFAATAAWRSSTTAGRGGGGARGGSAARLLARSRSASGESMRVSVYSRPRSVSSSHMRLSPTNS